MFCWTVHLNGGPKLYGRAVVAVKHKVLVFGGRCDGNRVQMDVHVFNTVSLRWRTLSPKIDVRGDLEGPSRGHTAVLIEDVVYIWGGYCWERDIRNELRVFDVDAYLWMQDPPKVSGTAPDGSFFHSACVLGKVMYVYGGYNRTLLGCNNDLYKLDTATMAWTSINARGTPPHASSSHSATIVGTKMFVFGGNGGRGVQYDTVRVFDTEAGLWLSTPSSAQILPEGRWGHAAFVYDGELCISGGHNWDQKSFNDVWKFNLETFSWKKVEPTGKRPPRMYFMGVCVVGDRVVLFDRSLPRDEDDPAVDLFILDLCPSLKTLCKLAVIRYSLDLSELTHDIRWEVAAMTTVVENRVPGETIK